QADTAGTPAWWRLVALTAACFLATLVNPYHVRLYGVVLEYATQPGPFRVVNELMAMDFREGWDWLTLALTLATAYALGRKRQLSPSGVLLSAFGAVLCSGPRGDVGLVALSALVILPGVIPPVKSLGCMPKLGRGVAAAVAVAFVVLAVVYWRGRGMTEE